MPLILIMACSGPEETQADLTVIALGDTVYTASLTCPPGGTHKDPEAACAALEDADGDIGAIEPDDTVCPAVSEPVWVAVTGDWGGERVEWAERFANLCQAKSETAGVIDFV